MHQHNRTTAIHIQLKFHWCEPPPYTQSQSVGRSIPFAQSARNANERNEMKRAELALLLRCSIWMCCCCCMYEYNGFVVARWMSAFVCVFVFYVLCNNFSFSFSFFFHSLALVLFNFLSLSLRREKLLFFVCLMFFSSIYPISSRRSSIHVSIQSSQYAREISFFSLAASASSSLSLRLFVLLLLLASFFEFFFFATFFFENKLFSVRSFSSSFCLLRYDFGKHVVTIAIRLIRKYNLLVTISRTHNANIYIRAHTIAHTHIFTVSLSLVLHSVCHFSSAAVRLYRHLSCVYRVHVLYIELWMYARVSVSVCVTVCVCILLLHIRLQKKIIKKKNWMRRWTK